MIPIFAQGNKNTHRRLIDLRKKALKDRKTRIAQRIHSIILSLEGYTTGDISSILKVHRSSVSIWINNWNLHKDDGLLEGYHSGRKRKISENDLQHLHDILESGPVAYGLDTAVWTSPIIAALIEEEFGISYHPGHVRKVLKKMGFSVQRPTTKLVDADPSEQNKWIRYTYPNLKKTPREKMQ